MVKMLMAGEKGVSLSCSFVMWHCVLETESCEGAVGVIVVFNKALYCLDFDFSTAVFMRKCN